MKVKASDENIKVPKKIKKDNLKELAEYRDKLRISPNLRSLFIEMTLACNEHCRHCGSSCGDIMMKDILSNDEIISFLISLKSDLEEEKKPLPFLNITGGEPLLRKGFIKLMKEVHSLGYEWGMTSNGLLIDEKMANSLKDAGMYSVSISIDGLESTHDWFRQKEKSYERAMNAVDLLVAQNFENVMITTVVHKKNINELNELLEIVKSKKVDTWRIINVDPIGRAASDKEIRLDTLDYKYILDFIKEKREQETSLDVTYGCNHFLGLKYEREVRPWYFLCNAGIYTGGVLYNGDISACLDIDRTKNGVIQGNIRKDKFLDVWNNKFEIYRKDRTLNSSTCKDCKYRYECGGEGFHTWDVDKNEPMLCMYNELKKAKKILKEKKET